MTGRTHTDQLPRADRWCETASAAAKLCSRGAIAELGCVAHARRKFVELHIGSKSSIAATALDLIGELNQVEHDIQAMTDPPERFAQRCTRAGTIAQKHCTRE